jgi:predicted MFS family arabinose efflux permease
MFGIGSIVAALFIGAARRRWGTEAVLATATLAYIGAQTELAAAHTLATALPATLLAGAGWVAGLTTINVAMQMRSPDRILGRCLSIYQAITFGGMALGSWLWGALADWRGLPFALHGASVFLLVTHVVLWLLAPMPAGDEGRID